MSYRLKLILSLTILLGFAVSGSAQCEHVLNTYGLGVFGDGSGTGSLSTLTGLDTVSAGGFADFVGCSGAEIYFDGSGFHDFWLEEGANMQLESASGFFNIYATNNNTIHVVSASGGASIYVGAGSTVIINDWGSAFTIYVECGGTIIIDSPQNFHGDIVAECPDDDIIDVQGSLNASSPAYTITECDEVSFNLTPLQIPGVILDIGGAVDVDCTTFPYTLDASSVSGPYTWSTGETSATIQVNSPGTYTCSVPSTCGTSVGTAILISSDGEGLDLGEENDYCTASYPITLDAGLFDSYLWNDGSTGQTLVVNEPGMYSVDVSSPCGTFSDQVIINAFPDAPSINWDYDPTDCNTTFPLELDAGEFDSYLWGTGETTQTFMANDPGVYSVEVTNNCGSATYTISLATETTPPSIDWGPDLDLCSADFPMILDVGVWDEYLWDYR